MARPKKGVSEKVVTAEEKKEAKKASTPKASDSLSKKVEKEASEKAKKDDGFEILEGIPDSEYFKFEDRSLNSLFAAMFGTPGLTRGKIYEIAGKSDVGKSALALRLIGFAQKQGEKGFDIDVEKGLNKEFAKKLGIDASKLMVISPDHGEGAMKGLRVAIRDKGRSFGVLDSSTACLPENETNDAGGGMGAQARMMSSEMKKVDKIVAKHGAILFVISQVKTKPGVAFGNPEYVSSGGSAVGFHSRVRMVISKVEVEKDDKASDAIFQKQEKSFTMRLVISKNHTGPKRTVPFDLIVGNPNMFDIELTKTAVRWAKNFKLVDTSKKSVAGIPFEGRGTEKDLEEVLKGQEYVVFEAVDAIFKAREDGLDVVAPENAEEGDDMFKGVEIQGDVGSDEFEKVDLNAVEEDDGEV